MEIFAESKEMEGWRTLWENGLWLSKRCNELTSLSVNDFRTTLLADDEAMARLNWNVLWCVGIVDNLEKSQIYEICDRVCKIDLS